MNVFTARYTKYLVEFQEHGLPNSQGTVDILTAVSAVARRSAISTFGSPDLLKVDEGSQTFYSNLSDFENAKGKAIVKKILLPPSLTKKSWEDVQEKRKTLVNGLE